jgi:hypothetical protein
MAQVSPVRTGSARQASRAYTEERRLLGIGLETPHVAFIHPPSKRPSSATMVLTCCARSQGSNPWQTQGMALDVSLLAHFPLDPIASLRYKTSISLTLWSAGWRRHGSTG